MRLLWLLILQLSASIIDDLRCQDTACGARIPPM